MGKRRVAILGSTGSIGRQALDVIRQHKDLFEVELLTANNSTELLVRQAIEFDANNVVICNEEKYAEVAEALQPKMIKVFAGMDSVCDLVKSDNIDIVLTSMVGFSGLRSTVAAIEAGENHSACQQGDTRRGRLCCNGTRGEEPRCDTPGGFRAFCDLPVPARGEPQSFD